MGLRVLLKIGSLKSSSNSSSLRAPQSRYQELEVALDSSSTTINQLNENVESLKQQKKQVEHQLEEEKKANYGNTQSTNGAVRGESKDLVSHLQYSLQRIGELEQAPSAVSMQQQEEDRNSENKSALQLEQQVKELQEKKLSEEMKEDIWTVRRRRHLGSCQTSQRTWRARRPW
ncbi:golgin subfamily A member 6C-like isoform X3 [Trachypithecus francoisi]|uniref:golgin subfamily A member 6C-like isoform X3 n=1 Tax=Trachypithecus francoisi TaxID=54180 RepID=UPI00141BE4E5|nr:golgin subfamily A member 6C-like isoform X3 [Trachypithecus francoisi]